MFFIHGGIWKQTGKGNEDFGGQVLPPDNCFTIRHPASLSSHTVFRSFGEVETGVFTIPLFTRDNTAQDNHIGLPRPIAVTLDELNLKQSGSFRPSNSMQPFGMRDQLLVYDNLQALINRSSSTIYYVYNDEWKRVGGGSANRGNDVIPAGAGFIIRKFATSGMPTSLWENPPNFGDN